MKLINVTQDYTGRPNAYFDPGGVTSSAAASRWPRSPNYPNNMVRMLNLSLSAIPHKVMHVNNLHPIILSLIIFAWCPLR